MLELKCHKEYYFRDINYTFRTIHDDYQSVSLFCDLTKKCISENIIAAKIFYFPGNENLYNKGYKNMP